MSLRRIVYRDEVYVSVQDAAGCYGIRVTELEEWMAEELLEPSRDLRGVAVLPVVELDRIAALVRCTRLLGLDPSAIRALADSGGLDRHRT